MVGPIMEKLFGCMMDRKMITWMEKNAKRAKRQAAFRAKDSTIDHSFPRMATKRHMHTGMEV